MSDRSSDTGVEADPLELSAGGEALASCIQFSIAELARLAEVAFEGTVVSADGSMVSLSVDRWFKGGGSAEGVLEAPRGMEALIAGIPFAVGERYLITAHGGTVNYCGFSGPSTPGLRASFGEAFGV